MPGAERHRSRDFCTGGTMNLAGIRAMRVVLTLAHKIYPATLSASPMACKELHILGKMMGGQFFGRPGFFLFHSLS